MKIILFKQVFQDDSFLSHLLSLGKKEKKKALVDGEVNVASGAVEQ